MPPTIWTSKWRIPSVRLDTSRTAAKASGRISSRTSSTTFSRRSRSSAVASASRAPLVVEDRGLILTSGLGDVGPEGVCERDELLVGARLHLGLEGVDLLDPAQVAGDLAVVGVAQDLQQETHGYKSTRRGGRLFPFIGWACL